MAHPRSLFDNTGSKLISIHIPDITATKLILGENIVDERFF
jgi:hypothetical protein